MCNHQRIRQSGSVLLAVLLLMSVLSYWVVLGIETAKLSWHITKNHWNQLQLQQVLLQSFHQAKQQLLAGEVTCQLTGTVTYQWLQQQPASWWGQHGCHGQLGRYDYEYTVGVLSTSESEVVYEVTSHAHIGFMEQYSQADFQVAEGQVVRLNYR